jgi:hypothetical protein
MKSQIYKNNLKIKTMNLTINETSLKELWLLTKYCQNYLSFDHWKYKCKIAYIEYYNRNLNDLEKYGLPLIYQEWINKQINEIINIDINL